jgi:hypothetical protein
MFAFLFVKTRRITEKHVEIRKKHVEIRGLRNEKTEAARSQRMGAARVEDNSVMAQILYFCNSN